MNSAHSVMLPGLPALADGNLSSINSQQSRWPPMMWLNTDRFLYLGWVGRIAERCFGSLAIYLSPEGLHRIRVGDKSNDWQATQFSIVQPWCKHWIDFDERTTACMLLLEPETLKLSALPILESS